MKKIISILLIVIMTASMAGHAFADCEEETASEEAVVVFESAQAAASQADESGAEYEGFIIKLDPSEEIDADQIEGMEAVDEAEGLFTAESLEVIEETISSEIIEYIEPDYILELFDEAEPNDEYYLSDQWNIPEMNVLPLWKEGIEGQDLDDSIDMDHDGNSSNDPVIVAVVDTGLNVYHEDIDATRVTGSWNVLDNSSDVTDRMGHGTFVTGLIMAVKNNVVGIAGLCRDINVMPVKAFDSNTAQTSNVVNALNHIISQKRAFTESNGAEGINVSVINISFGGSSSTESLKNAVEAAINAGIIVICAAGNNGNTDATYPAMYALGVGSYDRWGNVSSFSRRLSADNGEGYNNKVWVSAPGESLTSTYAGNSSYETKSGTSYSCPAVAALAGICKGLDNSLDHYRFKRLLMQTAIPKNSGLGNIDGQDIGFGWGVVDFQAAVEAVSSDEDVHEDGWYQAEDGIWYYYMDGDLVTDWQLINNKWYYFNTSGQMQTGWLLDAGTWYYLKESGAMIYGWANINGKWYYFKRSGAMVTGWIKIDKVWYYLKESGAMATGWIEDEDTWYYMKSSGAMAVNEWVSGYWWLSSNGAWTYKYKGSWHHDSRGWWFGDTSGWYARNTTITINNIRYTFGADGYLK